MKKINYIDTAGQVTAVTTSLQSATSLATFAQNEITNNRCEQAGFLDTNTNPFTFTMMGGELCINGTLAAGFVALESMNTNEVMLSVATITTPISIEKKKNSVTALFPNSIIKSISQNKVSFSGISYILLKGIPKKAVLSKSQKQLLSELLRETPAAGIIFFEKNMIAPVIAVGKTSTLIWESACGSGSLALSLVTGQKEIVQPSGQIISIFQENGTLSVSTSVRKV